MKFLLDENLSFRLVRRIEDLFPGSTHVRSVDLLQAPDREIWTYAREHEFALLTADADFYEMATALGSPPKVVWLRGCDYANAIAEEIIRRESIRISEFLNNSHAAVLILNPARS